MLLSVAIKTRISELMKEHNISSLHELTLLAGIPYATVNDFFRCKTGLLKIDKIVFICDALGIELKDFFNSSVFKNVICDKE